MKIVGMVQIKLNNERLPGKNIKKLNGKPLIHYILSQLSKCKQLDELYVFCSDKKILPYLKSFPKIKFLQREKALDGKKVKFGEIFESFYKKVKADIYVCGYATAPLLQANSISKCIDAVVSKKYDSAFTATKLNTFVWVKGKPNYTLSDIERTQDLPPVIVETTGCYVFTSDVFKKYHARTGKKPYIHIVSNEEGIDVDEQKDFDLASYLIQNNKL